MRQIGHDRLRFKWLLTMLVILVGWVLFRSESLPAAAGVLQRMLDFSNGVHWYPPLVIAALFCCGRHAAWRTRLRIAMRLPFSTWYSPVLTTVMIWALLYAPRNFQPFVYFRRSDGCLVIRDGWGG